MSAAGIESAVDVLTLGETMVALRGSGPLKPGGSMDLPSRAPSRTWPSA
ncbi:hypothetical protein AB0O76_03375 [Streptomyces sp. NPDC086554]